MKKKLETLQNHIIYDDYKKQVQVHKNKKHIIECFFVLVIGIIATISMITSNSDITPTENSSIRPDEPTESPKKIQKDYEDLKKQYDTLKKQYDALNQDIKKRIIYISNYGKMRDKLKEEQTNLIQDIEEKNNKLNDYSKACNTLKERQTNLIQYIEESQLKVKILLQQRDSKQKELQSLKDCSNPWLFAEEDINKIKSEIVELENQLSSKRAERQNLIDDINFIPKRIRTRIEKKYNQEDSIYMIPQKKSEDDDDENENENENEEEDDDDENYRLELERLERELTEVDDQIAMLSSTRDETNERIHELENRYIERRQNGTQKFEQRQEKIKQELEQLSTQYNETERKNVFLNEELNRVKISLSISEKEYNSLQKKIKDKENQAQKLQTTLSTYKKQYDSRQKEIKDKENQAQKLQNELNKLQPLLNKIYCQ